MLKSFRLAGVLALLLAGIVAPALPAHAQGCGQQNPNCIVPTAPPNTSNNQAASTEFVARWFNTLGTMAYQNANAVAITGGTITGMPNPVNPADVANKQYVDSIAAGLTVLAPSGLATATTLPNSPTYSNGTAGVGATLTAGSNSTLTVDGTVATLNSVVLVKNQASAFQNGIYTVTTAGSGGAPWVLTRASYFDQAAEMTAGSYTFITGGATNANSAYTLQTTVATVGTDALTFTLFSQTGTTIGGQSGTILLDPTLTMTGKTLSVTIGPIYLTSYGAKCDGATHDEVAFQNALNAAITARGPLVLPPNAVCVLAASITNGSTLFTTTIIQGYGQTSEVKFVGNAGFQFSAPNSYYVLQDFQINCDTTSSLSCLGTFNGTGGSTAYGSVFQRLAFTGCGVICVYFQNLVQAQFVNNTLLTSAAAGTAALFIDNSLTSDVGGNFISGNRLINLGGSTTSGMYLQEFGGSQIQNNQIDGYGHDVFYAMVTSAGSTGVLFQGNQLDDCKTSCLWFDAGSIGASMLHVVVTGNTMHSAQGTGCPLSAGGYGIVVNSAINFQFMNNISITGNTIDTCHGGAGINIFSSDGLTISGNSIRDADGPHAGAAILLNTTNGGITHCSVVGNVNNGYNTTLSNGPGCPAAANTP